MHLGVGPVPGKERRIVRSRKIETIAGALGALRAFCAMALTLLMLTHLAPAAFGAESVASQITAMPPGSKVELRLKNKHKVSGTTGPASRSGFTLVDSNKGEHQIAFDDVISVKRITAKRRATEIAVIGVGIAAVVVGVVIAVAAHNFKIGKI